MSAPWLEIAWKELGVREIAGPAAHDSILAMFRNAGRDDITSDEVPWCAAFVASCLALAGVPNPLPKDDRLLARKYLGIGSRIEGPRVGALCVLRRDGPPGAGHIGIVTAWTDSMVKLLGGNQQNEVNETWFDRRHVLGYVWPEPPATPQEIAARGSRIARAAQRQARDATKATGTGGGGQMVPTPAAAPQKPPGMRELAEQATGFKGWIETAEAFATFAWAKAPWILGGIAAYFLARMAYDAWLIKRARTEDANEGWSPVVMPAARESVDVAQVI